MKTLAEIERNAISRAMKLFDGHREKAAEALGISVRTLFNKLREHSYGNHAERGICLEQGEKDDREECSMSMSERQEIQEMPSGLNTKGHSCR